MEKQLIILGVAVLLISVGLSGCNEQTGIKTTDMSVEEIKSNSINVSYNDLMRNIEEYKGKIVHLRGGVLQAIEHDNYDTLRIATEAGIYLGYYDDEIAVNYKGSRIFTEEVNRNITL